MLWPGEVHGLYSPWGHKESDTTEQVFLSVKWMNLEPVIQSEVSQKEKNKYHKLKHIYGVKKNGTDKPICKAAIEVQTQRTDRPVNTTVEGEGGMN